MCTCSWGKFWTKDTKRPKKAQLPVLKSWEQKQGTAHAPCTQHHKGVGKPPQPPLRPDSWIHPWGASKQWKLLFVLAPACCGRGPSKALPGLLVWLPISLYRLRRPRALVSNTYNLCSNYTEGQNYILYLFPFLTTVDFGYFSVSLSFSLILNNVKNIHKIYIFTYLESWGPYFFSLIVIIFFLLSQVSSVACGQAESHFLPPYSLAPSVHLCTLTLSTVTQITHRYVGLCLHENMEDVSFGMH